MVYNEVKSYPVRSALIASPNLGSYHHTKTQAEGSGQESVTFCDGELLHAGELADNYIDAYYAGPENASHAADACHHPSPGIVIESHLGEEGSWGLPNTAREQRRCVTEACTTMM